jgi:hypothetical protein
MLIDLRHDQIVYVDVYSGRGFGTQVETAGVGTADLVAAVAARHRTRVSVAEVAGAAVLAPWWPAGRRPRRRAARVRAGRRLHVRRPVAAGPAGDSL